MKIRKSVLLEALKVLGKVVCQTSPVEVQRSVRFLGSSGSVVAMVTDGLELVALKLDVGTAETVDCTVEYRGLREMIRSTRGGVVEVIGKRLDWPEAEVVPDDAETVALPENFTALLAEAASLVDLNEARFQLRGIHLCSAGIVVTDGKQLLHLPVDWTLKTPVTLPFPLALLTAKPEAPGTLTVWKLKDIQLFKIEIGGSFWLDRAIAGNYPEWRKVIPETSAHDYAITFSPEQAAQLTGFLKTVPDCPPFHAIELNVVQGGVAVIPNNFPDMELRLEATVIGAQPRAVLALNKYILLRMLQQGYTEFRAHSDGRLPVIAEGSSGRYLAMPIHILTKQPKKETSKMENIKRIEHAETTAGAEPVNPMEVRLSHRLDNFC